MSESTLRKMNESGDCNGCVRWTIHKPSSDEECQKIAYLCATCRRYYKDRYEKQAKPINAGEGVIPERPTLPEKFGKIQSEYEFSSGAMSKINALIDYLAEREGEIKQ